MNPGRWLAISVVLNLGLAGLIGWRVLSKPAPALASSTPSATPQPLVNRVVETNEVVKFGSVVQQNWRTVEDADYRKYIANLRAIGCPEDTIRDIIILDLNKQYLDRFREAHPPRPFKYWDTSQSGLFRSGRNTEQRERESSQIALSREKRELVRELLGVDLAEELAKYHMSVSRADLENMWTFLPAEKRNAVRDLQTRYDDTLRTLRAQADPDGRLSPELQQQLKDLKAKQDAALAQALAPGELEQYQMRFSNTAANVRLALSAFDPTEDEFKRIFPIRKAYDDIYADPSFDRTDPQQAQRRAAAYAVMEEQMKSVLSADRFAEYQRSRDDDYRNAYVFVKTWELPRETALKLYEVKKAVDASLRELKASTALDDATRKTMQAAAQAETEKALKGLLGERTYQGYVRNQGRSLVF